MGVIKRSNSPYWYIQFQLNGKTYIKSSKTTDKRFATQMESNWKRQLMTEEVFGIKQRVLIEQAVLFYQQIKVDLVCQDNLKWFLRMIVDYFKTKQYIDEIKTADIEQFKSHLCLTYSNQTTKHVISAFRGIWRHSRRLGYQVSDLEFPVIKISKGRLRYLTIDEEQRLLQSLDPKRSVKGLPIYENRNPKLKSDMKDLYDFICLLLDTGARFNEIASLKWQSIQFDKGTIALWRSKVSNESILYMTARTREILESRKLISNTEYVFANRTGGPRRYTGTTLRRAFLRVGLDDCSAHTLRHTHASRLIQNGMSIYEVKEILGHTDIRTTMRYSHLEMQSVFLKQRAVIEQLERNRTAIPPVESI